MNFSHLANNCAEYSKDKLKPEDALYISGMEYVKNEILDDFIANIYPEDDESTTLMRIEREVAVDVIQKLKDYITVSVAEAQVSLIDMATDADEY